MGMNVGSSENSDDVMIEMNMTPLIDVMLVLIIMLIVTIPIQNHAIRMDNPQGDPPPVITEPVVINVAIDPTGIILWNGETLLDHDDLENKLRNIAQKQDQDEVRLRPNRLTDYRVVAEVLAAAQRLGITKIGIVGNEQFIND